MRKSGLGGPEAGEAEAACGAGRPQVRKRPVQWPAQGWLAGRAWESVHEEPDQDQDEGRDTKQPGEDIGHGATPVDDGDR
ncbi:hypothetical protein CNECB9_5350015 [Cupriavidus necator]|uniref:Uncharacterized protein n=1 Tax=Cupriavidus necator TaxID=106590 RepID=A0A1K0IQ42_CUPNE|nr:hypothetical protein CNECB9_5350015 [Cupriavidus necator]